MGLIKIEGYLYLRSAADISVKLDFDNYDIWRAQWKALLQGLDLIGYVDGSMPEPPPTAWDKFKKQEQPNWNHKIWYRQTKLLLHAILVSISDKFLKRLVLITQLNTAEQAWNEISKTAAKDA
ncbi:hypothetical protein COLO4_21697 [Corchorus olitorius]|uniref:Retrotransposon Copia-like N-terminal domain-containing protein n=1 Tax=Corchorus olitorius TaxID=93759 RepID=A0A1R3IRN5_9ROSI|nr:hypothetical protein COLO4_21697 [Corchorus olitorius]